jgi:flagellar basal body P-ring protein FlgI
MVTPDVKVDTKEEKARNVVLNQGASVEEAGSSADLRFGSTARDISAILQSLKAAGAIQAELEAI